MIRNKEFSRICNLIKGLNCVLIIAPFGWGKTYLLKRLCRKFNGVFLESPSMNTKSLQKISSEKWNRKSELFEEVFSQPHKIIFIDDLQEADKNSRTAILKISKNHTVVAACEYIKDKRFFQKFRIVELKKLSWKDIYLFIKITEPDLNCEAQKWIAKKSYSNFSKAESMMKEYKTTGKINEFKEKKDIFPYIMFAGYVLLSLRYLMMIKKEWELYSIFSLIAYSILSLRRFKHLH